MRLLPLFFVSLLTVSCFVAPQDTKTDVTIAHTYLNTAVQVLVIDSMGNVLGTGSGTIIKSDDNTLLVLTAKHVVTVPPHIEVDILAVVQGVRTEAATVMYLHDERDVAILKIPHLRKESSANMATVLKPLTEVVTAGFPVINELIVSQGLLNFRSLAQPLLWMCTAPIAPGNSGAGVFDKETGDLLGVSIAVACYANGFRHQLITYIHFMQPVMDIRPWIDSIMETI